MITTATKTTVQAAATTHELSRTAMVTTTAVSSLIGLWAVACFVGALINAGGPLSVMKGFFTAVAGL